MGDSAVDIPMFSLADISFAIEPKGSLEEHVDHVIKDMREINMLIKRAKPNYEKSSLINISIMI